MTRKEEFNKAINKALELLDEIEENTNTCCAITMEPEDVLILIDKLRKILNEQGSK